jgi:hypothetical protein
LLFHKGFLLKTKFKVPSILEQLERIPFNN